MEFMQRRYCKRLNKVVGVEEGGLRGLVERRGGELEKQKISLVKEEVLVVNFWSGAIESRGLANLPDLVRYLKD